MEYWTMMQYRVLVAWVSATYILQKEASWLGTTFKYIQMTIVGPHKKCSPYYQEETK